MLNLKTWIKNHRTKSILITGVILVAIGSCAAYAFYVSQSPGAKLFPDIKVAERVKYYSPLTGVEIPKESKDKLNQPVTAIMIENSPDARPQSGLKQAGVVYEAIAEAGITRFLALYQEAKPELIGPVRSVRMYYVDWLTPYQASVAHVGGSAKALELVRNGSYRDIDQFFNPGTYWRASDRFAPHNVYTNFEKLDSLNASKGFKESKFSPWPRKNQTKKDSYDAKNIDINFSSASYNTSYTYDENTNAYNRTLGGEPHNDREKGQIAPNVVIAMQVDMSHVLEDGYRESIKTIGSGKATIFQDGSAIEATWTKNSKSDNIKFTDSSGKEVKLNRGQTWIAAVPNGQGSVSWK